MIKHSFLRTDMSAERAKTAARKRDGTMKYRPSSRSPSLEEKVAWSVTSLNGCRYVSLNLDLSREWFATKYGTSKTVL
jgi:hypothetical protein